MLAPGEVLSTELRGINYLIAHPLNKNFLIPFFAGGGIGIINLGAAERTGFKPTLVQHLTLFNGKVIHAAFIRAGQIR